MVVLITTIIVGSVFVGKINRKQSGSWETASSAVSIFFSTLHFSHWYYSTHNIPRYIVTNSYLHNIFLLLFYKIFLATHLMVVHFLFRYRYRHCSRAEVAQRYAKHFFSPSLVFLLLIYSLFYYIFFLLFCFNVVVFFSRSKI